MWSPIVYQWPLDLWRTFLFGPSSVNNWFEPSSYHFLAPKITFQVAPNYVASGIVGKLLVWCHHSWQLVRSFILFIGNDFKWRPMENFSKVVVMKDSKMNMKIIYEVEKLHNCMKSLGIFFYKITVEYWLQHFKVVLYLW